MKTRLRALMRAALPALVLVASGSVFCQSKAWPISTSRNVATLGPHSIGPGNFNQAVLASVTGGIVVDMAAPQQVFKYDLPLRVKAPISTVSAGVAIGNFARRVAPPLAVASALYQLAQDLGFGIEVGPSGELVVKERSEGLNCVSDCFEYRVNNVNAPTWYQRPFDAADPWLRAQLAQNPQIVNIKTTVCTTVRPIECSLKADHVNFGPNWAEARLTLLDRPVPPYNSTTIRDSDLDTLVDRIKSAGSGASLLNAVRDAIINGEVVPTGEPTSVEGPTSLPGDETVTQSDGVTTTTTTTNNFNYAGNTITNNSTTTKIERNSTTNEIINTTIITNTPGTPQVKEETPSFEMPCGITGTPPCNVKVDESGVPVPTDIKIDQADDALDDWDDFVTNLPDVLPKFPTISWDFELPTGCGVIPLPGFEPYLTGVDICQYQPMFHSLMSVVWVLGGLFGAISLFMRSALTMN